MRQQAGMLSVEACIGVVAAAAASDGGGGGRGAGSGVVGGDGNGFMCCFPATHSVLFWVSKAELKNIFPESVYTPMCSSSVHVDLPRLPLTKTLD